jgi:hypothetical protein
MIFQMTQGLRFLIDLADTICQQFKCGNTAVTFAVLNMCEQSAQWIACYSINGMDRIISSPCSQGTTGETFAKSSH